jgi:hypothetical protein
MTRDAALREIARTTDFEFRDGKVVVRSVQLLSTIEQITRSRPHDRVHVGYPAAQPATLLPSWA